MTHTPARRLATRALALTTCAALASLAHAQQGGAASLPVPENVVSLTASASVEITKDWLTVVFSTTREGADASVVQAQLKQALDTALAEARKQARPGQVEVQTGNFSLYPRYAAKGGISGWQGSAELVVEGRDTPAIAQLAGRVQTLTLGRVQYSLSREARQKVEGDVTAQAIERFRARADAVSRQFGFAGYTVREVVVNTEAPMAGQGQMLSMQSARAVAADTPLPTEAGKASVTATVSGSVQMK